MYDGISGWFNSFIVRVDFSADFCDGNALRRESVTDHTASWVFLYDGISDWRKTIIVRVDFLVEVYDGISGWLKSVIVHTASLAQFYDGNALRLEPVTARPDQRLFHRANNFSFSFMAGSSMTHSSICCRIFPISGPGSMPSAIRSLPVTARSLSETHCCSARICL